MDAMNKTILIALCILLIVVASGSAQDTPKWLVGFGWAGTSMGDLGGSGFHGHLAGHIPRISIFDNVRIAASAGNGNANGSPFSCQQAPQIYCFGRKDEHVWAELDVMPMIGATEGDAFSFYAMSGPGIFFRRTRSYETQGPTTLCIIDGELVSCPDNPPFQGFSKTDRVWGAAWTLGFGLRGTSSLKWFIEMRAHLIWEGGDERSALLPIMVGIGF
jgi:hypothetical protein